MTTALAQVRQSSNYASDLSPDQKRAIRFYAAAHMAADEIAARLLLPDAEQVRDYCKSIYINVK